MKKIKLKKLSNILQVINVFLLSNILQLKVLADNDLTVTINKGADSEYKYGNGSEAAKQLKEILTNDNNNGLMDITTMAGSLIFAFGLCQLILAFKDDNQITKLEIEKKYGTEEKISVKVEEY